MPALRPVGFDGIHLDIEPYVLPQWAADHDAVIQTWESNLSAFLGKTSGSGLELGIDIPFWFDGYSASGAKRSMNG